MWTNLCRRHPLTRSGVRHPRAILAQGRGRKVPPRRIDPGAPLRGGAFVVGVGAVRTRTRSNLAAASCGSDLLEVIEAELKRPFDGHT